MLGVPFNEEILLNVQSKPALNNLTPFLFVLFFVTWKKRLTYTFYNHLSGSLVWKRPFKGHLVQSHCSKGRYLQLDQIVASPMQPGLECFLGWGMRRKPLSLKIWCSAVQEFWLIAPGKWLLEELCYIFMEEPGLPDPSYLEACGPAVFHDLEPKYLWHHLWKCDWLVLGRGHAVACFVSSLGGKGHRVNWGSPTSGLCYLWGHWGLLWVSSEFYFLCPPICFW